MRDDSAPFHHERHVGKILRAEQASQVGALRNGVKISLENRENVYYFSLNYQGLAIPLLPLPLSLLRLRRYRRRARLRR